MLLSLKLNGLNGIRLAIYASLFAALATPPVTAQTARFPVFPDLTLLRRNIDLTKCLAIYDAEKDTWETQDLSERETDTLDFDAVLHHGNDHSVRRTTWSRINDSLTSNTDVRESGFLIRTQIMPRVWIDGEPHELGPNSRQTPVTYLPVCNQDVSLSRFASSYPTLLLTTESAKQAADLTELLRAQDQAPALLAEPVSLPREEIETMGDIVTQVLKRRRVAFLDSWFEPTAVSLEGVQAAPDYLKLAILIENEAEKLADIAKRAEKSVARTDSAKEWLRLRLPESLASFNAEKILLTEDGACDAAARRLSGSKIDYELGCLKSPPFDLRVGGMLPVSINSWTEALDQNALKTRIKITLEGRWPADRKRERALEATLPELLSGHHKIRMYDDGGGRGETCVQPIKLSIKEVLSEDPKLSLYPPCVEIRMCDDTDAQSDLCVAAFEENGQAVIRIPTESDIARAAPIDDAKAQTDPTADNKGIKKTGLKPSVSETAQPDAKDQAVAPKIEPDNQADDNEDAAGKDESLTANDVENSGTNPSEATIEAENQTGTDEKPDEEAQSDLDETETQADAGPAAPKPPAPRPERSLVEAQPEDSQSGAGTNEQSDNGVGEPAANAQ